MPNIATVSEWQFPFRVETIDGNLWSRWCNETDIRENVTLQMAESKAKPSADDLSRTFFTQNTRLGGLGAAVTTLLATEE